MKLIPLEDRIIVRPDEAKEKTEAGIIIPEVSQVRPPIGTVLSVGPGKDGDPYLKKILGLLCWGLEQDGEVVPTQFRPADNKITSIKEGDRIYYGRMCGTPIEIDGEELLVIRYTDVITILVDE